MAARRLPAWPARPAQPGRAWRVAHTFLIINPSTIFQVQRNSWVCPTQCGFCWVGLGAHCDL